MRKPARDKVHRLISHSKHGAQTILHTRFLAKETISTNKYLKKYHTFFSTQKAIK